MVGIPQGLFSPFGLGINTLLNGEALYSLVGGTGWGICTSLGGILYQISRY